MKDELGDRMKSNYENRTRYYLPRRTYSIIRIDGKAFHTYTKGLKQPFDEGLISDMDETAIYLCKNIQGAKFGFVQSDEISILMTDFDNISTDAWFDGNIQKIVSIAASMATAKFNQLRMIRKMNEYCAEHDTQYFPNHNGMININFINDIKLAQFDARVFTIPSKIEVMNYFIFRQKDTVRNSISSVAQSLCSHNELNGKSTNEMQEMIFQKGDNWNDYPAKYKRGRFIEKQLDVKEPDIDMLNSASATRSKWVSTECPIFTQDNVFLLIKILDNF